MEIFAIKHRTKLTWEDLPFIEAPVFAHTHIMNMLIDPNHPWLRIDNIDEFFRNEIGSYDALRNHDYANDTIEYLIGSGQYFNVSRTEKPFCSAFAWQEDETHPHKGFWVDKNHYYWRASTSVKTHLMNIANQWHRLQTQEDSSSSFVITMENFYPRTLKWMASANSSKGMMLSSDMDPNFQMSGGTVEEWNQLNEEADLMRVIGKENRQMEIDALRSDPKAIQEFLISKGHVEVGAADGIIGKRTQLGIHNYINGIVAANEITKPLPKSVKAQHKQNRSGSPFENDYDQIIWDASEKYGVPPEILKAKIRKESTFNNAAVNKNNVDGSTTVGLG